MTDTGPLKRSITIAGHRTSLSLEPAFWHEIKALARAQGCSLAELGYDNATKIAKAAHKNGTTLRQEAVGMGFVTDAEFDQIVRPQDMIGPS